MMSRITGRLISRAESIRQSISDILTTPVGSRLMRREYGSLVPDLIDQPLNPVTILQLYSAVVMSVMRWEDRITLSSVRLTSLTSGQLELAIEGEEVDTSEQLNLNIPLMLGASV